MAYDIKVAERVRDHLSQFPQINVEEKKMFGGLAFMINGKMCVNVSGENLMCRFDPLLSVEVAERIGVLPMVMGGKEYKGYCYVKPEGFKEKSDFEYWMNLCLSFNDKAKASKQVGLTKDVGWQFGLSKTIPYSPEYLWDFMFSDRGLKVWLGELENPLEIKKTYSTKEGIEGMVRVFIPYSHIRINWKREDWDNISIVQVRVTGKGEKATISFHQERLLNDHQREEMKLYWNSVMTELEKVLAHGK